MNMEANLSAMTAVGLPSNLASNTTAANSAQNQGVAAMKEYKWYNANYVPLELQCGIIRLEFPEAVRLSSDTLPEDLTVSVQIISNQLPIFDPPLNTLFSQTNDQLNCIQWDHLLSFPVKIRDLSLDALLVFTVHGSDNTVYGGTSMRLFDEYGSLKQGKQKLIVFRRTNGDPNVVYNANQTPGEYYDDFSSFDYEFQLEKTYEQFLKKNSLNSSSVVSTNNNNTLSPFPSSQSFSENIRKDWLDQLFLKRMQQFQSQKPIYNRTNLSPEEEQDNEMLLKYLEDSSFNFYHLEELEIKKFSYLIIELPTLTYPVFYEDKQYPSVDPHIPPTSFAEILKECIIGNDENTIEFQLTGRHFNPTWLTVVADWDMNQENISEEQNRRLSHNVRKGAADSTVKPNKDEKIRIDQIINSSVNSQMSSSDMDFIYRFRYSLTENKKALIKFLYALNWDEENEVNELPILLALWRERAPIDVADALKLLSKDKSFEHPMVREYAVETLRSASDEELLTFLLQLVQALRYEPATAAATAAVVPSSSSSKPGPVVAMSRGDAGSDKKSSLVPSAAVVSSSNVPEAIAVTNNSTTTTTTTATAIETSSPLGNFLVDRACKSPVIANYLYWYLKVEREDEEDNSYDLFTSIFSYFENQLLAYSNETRDWYKKLMFVDNYFTTILKLQTDAIKEGKKREQKEQFLIKKLTDAHLSKVPINWIPLPLDPAIKLSGLDPASCSMFASAVYPCVIEFNEYFDEEKQKELMKLFQLQQQQQQQQQQANANPNAPPSAQVIMPPIPPPVPVKKTHKVMFKSGDDLRQDQLIMQMISLMDSLLKKVNLDLKLLTYGILAVSKKDGIMEFVRNSMAISSVLKNHGTIIDYLKKYNEDKTGPFGISPQVMDTFIKSCAGSCVITFILGIGDRHLDNIMINRSGQLFHIDFGFIFGQDPKPFPPPFRFTRSMADAMGGEDSEHYARFKTFCCQSYNWLRKSANLILNLLSLMGDAGINDISKRSDLSKVLLKIEEKFRLDLTDEQAEQYFLGLISESLHSLAPKIMEVAHKIAVSMR